jgi:hypothetical protein
MTKKPDGEKGLIKTIENKTKMIIFSMEVSQDCKRKKLLLL